MIDTKPIKDEYNQVLNQLSDPELISDWEKFERLSDKKKKLEKIINKEKEVEECKRQIEESKTILKTEEDRELVSLAEIEISQLQEKEKILEKELESLLRDSNSSFSIEDKKDRRTANMAVIIEIRAGTGGQEAALFAGDLFRMYSKYALLQNWKEKVLDSHPTELGGFKEIVFELKPGKQSKEKDIFAKIKYEGGVHRVQRVPETEKSGRIHTSTATVAVLPKPQKSEIKIRPEDLRVDIYKSSGPGGQNVNKRMTAVRITHLPTGIVVSSQNERNQLQNKENAMAILEARLLERKQREEEEKLGKERKTQIGWAKRAEKIRTYNFSQDRVTDHRIKKSWHNIEEIMDGKIEPIIKSLQQEDKKQL